MPKPKRKKTATMPAKKSPIKSAPRSNAKTSAGKKSAANKTASRSSRLLPKFTFNKLTAGIVIAVFAVAGSLLVLFGRADTSAKLAWAPPALSSPTTIEINSDIIKSRGTDGHKFYLDNTKDYLVKIGKVDSTLGGVVLAGGRNVVVMGGYITVPYAGTSPDIASRRGLLLYRQVGTVHVEGLLIDNAGGDLSEGINIDAPNAIVQIQNVRVTGIHARDQVNFSDNHPDLIQPYGGAKELRVDRFTGTTDSQGIFLTAAHAPIGKVDLRRVNFAVTNANYSYGFHRIDGNTTGTGEVSKFPVNASDVWVQPAPGKTFQRTVINQTCTTSGCKDYPITISSDGNTASWPTDSTFTGVVHKGIPGSGDFVPASSVGLNYVSPGYLSDPVAVPGNLAAGKPATTGGWSENLQRATDGDKNTVNNVNMAGGSQWLRLDLGQSHDLGRIKLWHYYGDGRTYRDVIVQLSNTADFSSGVITVFNNDADNSSGQGAGRHAEYAETSAGKEITFNTTKARYVRFWSNGSTANTANHYVEVEVYGPSTTTSTLSNPTTDNTAPAVTIAAPTNSLRIGRQVSIKASASDNVGVTKMQVYIDGRLQASYASGSISHTWNARRASNGAHTVTVKAYDAAGNTSQSSVTVYK